MFEKIKKIFKKKPKAKKEKRTYEKAIDHSNDITFENEIKQTKTDRRSDTKSDGTLSDRKSDTKSGLGG
ncbi:hypothetical protein [uncultured Mediterranean phage uvMED]|nr:hypothetical protein [uncultured Mediterranean phage uvMED]